MHQTALIKMFIFVLFTLFTMIFANVTITKECINVTIGSTFVNCRDQQLQKIPNAMPGNIIEIMDLADNHLIALPSFRQYPKLTELLVQRNDIVTIDENAFTELDNLKKVVLSDNDLSYISPDIFLHNPNLKIVSLQGNPLVQISTDNPILNAPSITDLDISYCSLSSLSPLTFSKLPNLETLDLTSNRLQSLYLEVFKDLPKLTTVTVSNNRFLCDCSLATLLEWIASIRPKGIASHKPVRCYDKDSSMRKMWPQVKQSMHCKSKLLTADRQISTDIPTQKLVPNYKEIIEKSDSVTDKLVYFDGYENVHNKPKSSNSVSKFYIVNQATINSILIVVGMLTATILGTCLVMKCITRPHHGNTNKCLHSQAYFNDHKQKISMAPLLDQQSFRSQLSVSDSEVHVYETVK